MRFQALSRLREDPRCSEPVSFVVYFLGDRFRYITLDLV
jgi:hypothetical protein